MTRRKTYLVFNDSKKIKEKKFNEQARIREFFLGHLLLGGMKLG